MQHGQMLEQDLVPHPDVIIKIVAVHPTAVEFKCILDGSDYHIDDMPSYNFDLMNFNEISDMVELLRRIAVSAFALAQEQEAKANFNQFPVSKLDFTKLLNRDIRISLKEAYSSSNFQVETHG